MVSGVPPKLAETLKRLRGGMSQKDLAEAIGVSPGTIGNVEAGTRNLGRESCEAVALALGLSEDETVELLTAAGHRSDSAVTRFADRLANVEADLSSQRELLEEQGRLIQSLLDRLPARSPAARPRRGEKR